LFLGLAFEKLPPINEPRLPPINEPRRLPPINEPRPPPIADSPPPPIADVLMEEEGQQIVVPVASRHSKHSKEEQDRGRNFKELLDPDESGLASREKKNFQKRETAKRNQVQAKRGQFVDACPNLCSDAVPCVHEDFPQQEVQDHFPQQEDLSSTCVGEAGEIIDKLEEQMKIDFQMMLQGACNNDDILSTDSEL
jgi:hypothetical protein